MKINSAENASASLAASAANAPELMGAEILVKALQAEGVQQVWGYPGGAVLYIYDALYKQNTIQHVLVRHDKPQSTRRMVSRAQRERSASPGYSGPA
jgi:Thiamine pyrophosphate-requiring enzymes [acetolactate synthase, pyruvate dehydrogenase (cytochrome), glyoxylate carboligase, phosphonopyruvate decarboxylase]